MHKKIKKGISPNKLNSLLKKWQKKLLLTDWDLSLEFVDFIRKPHQSKNFKQRGDFKADITKKKAIILMAKNPPQDDEEYTLLHEMIHILVWNLDNYTEETILKKYKYYGNVHGEYLGKLEDLVHHLTKILLGRSCGK